MKTCGIRHRRWIDYCLKKAQKNDVSLRCSHCSVLVKGGRPISIGLNKNRMGCLGDRVYKEKGWHSEFETLYRLDPDTVNGGILYVGGLTRGGSILHSKPCNLCQKYLSRFKLKAIYYSLPDNTYEMMRI